MEELASRVRAWHGQFRVPVSCRKHIIEKVDEEEFREPDIS